MTIKRKKAKVMDNNTLIFGGLILLVIVLALIFGRKVIANFTENGLSINTDKNSREAKVSDSKRVEVNQSRDSKTEISGSEDIKINQKDA